MYKNWKDFISSKSELLECVPEFSSMYKGTMYFSFVFNGDKYVATGSNDYVSSYDYTVGLKLFHMCDFDNFLLYKTNDAGDIIEEICNW